MIRSICLVSVLFIFAATIIEAQQQTASTVAPELRRQTLVVDINAKVQDDNQVVIWDQSERRTAMSGNPLSIRLVGSNLIVVVQFTPFIHNQGNVLVAQSQIWIETPDGVNYYTSIQNIPIDFNEPVHFFPLGTSGTSIEIIVTVSPYTIDGE